MRLRGLIKWAVLLLAIVLFGLTAIPSLPNGIPALFFFSSLAAFGLLVVFLLTSLPRVCPEAIVTQPPGATSNLVTFAGVSPAFAEAVRAMYEAPTQGI